MYDESWVEKLYRGFRRNLTRPFRFVCFTDRERAFSHDEIEQKPITMPRPIGYEACIEPFRLNEPMIWAGLDTVVIGNCDHFADYCMTADKLAVPRDPTIPGKMCNAVVLTPGGLGARMWDAFDKRTNDMDWINANPHAALDDLFPGQIKSFRVEVYGERACEPLKLGDARIVYFHGAMKPHEIGSKVILEHWR